MGAGKKVLAANVFVDGRLFLAGESPEKEFADQITNPKAWGGDEVDDKADTSGDAGVTPKGYSDLKSEDLEKLVADREVAVTGTGANDKVLKKDMVAALEAADAAAASE